MKYIALGIGWGDEGGILLLPLPSSDQGGRLELRAWDQADPVGGAASTACTVNQENGRVSATAATGTCYIQARFGAFGSYGRSDWFNISGPNGIGVGA